MGLAFVALMIVASLVLVIAAVKIGRELRSQPPAAGVAAQDRAPFGIDAR